LPSLYNQFDTFVIRLIWREAQLHARWHEIKHSATPPTSRHGLQDLLQVALDLDAEYQAWENTIPPAWRYESRLNTPEARLAYNVKWQKLVLTSEGAPAEIHTYKNLKRCSLCCYYRTSSIFLLRDLLEILNWMFRMPDRGQALSSQHKQQTTAQITANLQRSAKEHTITSLDNLELRNFQVSATTRMIDTIEKSCSIVLGSFTVPMYKKSLEDVMSIRGHVLLWSLGTMDSVLSAGLIPDSNSAISTAATSVSLPHVRITPPTGQDPTTSFHHDTSLDYAEHGLDYFTSLLEHGHSDSLPHSHLNQSPPTTNPPQSFKTANKEHPFDSTPKHTYDTPIDPRSLNVGATELKTMDVSAKRVWLNSMLYYIGTELGIRKALIVPHAEGYMPIVKPFVDGILGR
jgi:hypothetical protein